MSLSNKKRKAILRGWPEKGARELAAELGLSEREVKAVLREEGKLGGPSLTRPALCALAAVLLCAIAWAGYRALTRPGPAKLAAARGGLNVLFVTIDTCRADHLGSYGRDQARTPVLDGLAKSGVLFENAFALQPLTLPSHSTIFTGAHPARHGVEDNGLFILPARAETLAETLSKEGFATGAVISAFVLHRQFGLDQGFSHYDDALSSGRRGTSVGFDEMPAGRVSDRAIEWLGTNRDRRFFLWLHYFDPHADYNPPPGFKAEGMSAYDGEIAYVDHELGRVMAALQNSGLVEKTLVIVTSDHGESLGEHGEPTHGEFLYDSAMHVPMIFSLPGVLPAGVRADEQVCLMDLAPTVLEVLGIEPREGMQGRSLVPLFYRKDIADQPVVMETMAPWHEYRWSPSFAIRKDGWKYIRAPRPELYDLSKDPGELDNIIEDNRGRAEAMSRELTRLRSAFSEHALDRESGGMSEESRERLASLGYLFSGSGAGKPGPEAPDVKDMIGLLRMMKQAQTFHENGRTREALELMEKVLAKSPDSARALNKAGVWYAQAGDQALAEKRLERLVRTAPDFVEGRQNLAQLYADTGRLHQAEIMAGTLMQENPRSAKAHNLMGFILFRQKDYRRAVEKFKQAVELYPAFHEAWANMGAAHYHAGELESARGCFARAYEIMPGNERYGRMVRTLEEQLAGRQAE